MNHLRLECSEHCFRKIRKNAGRRISKLSTLVTKNVGKPDPCFRWLSCHRLNSSTFHLSSTRNGIGSISSFKYLDYDQSSTQHHRHVRRHQLQAQLRFQSSSTDDCGSKKSFYTEQKTKTISEDTAGFEVLQEAAFASKEIVERRLMRSVETAVWKSSTITEQKKMYRFFSPQLRKATGDLLDVTGDVKFLSALITKARENEGCKNATITSLRGLHSSFLQLTQIVLDNFDVAIESEIDASEFSDESSSHSLHMLELVLSLSYRASMLGLGYHWPLYQRIALAVAKHPETIEEKTPSKTSKTLGSLTNHSRGEWIQTIHRWSRFIWNSDNKHAKNESTDDESQQRKHEDLNWFHPALKVLAEEGHWPDVHEILVGLLRPDLDSTVTSNNYDTSSVGGKSGSYSTSLEDSIVLSSTNSVPYLDEDIVFDILVAMERQGLLSDLPENRKLFSQMDWIVDNTILLMEVSIWKIFYRIPSHVKATSLHEDIDISVTYAVRDAIRLLLKCGRTNLNEGDGVYDSEQEYLSDDVDEDSLVKALSELEDILDEHIDLGNDGDGLGDERNPPGSDPISLATAFANEKGHQGNRMGSGGDFSNLNAENVEKPSQKIEDSTSQSYEEYAMERTSMDRVSQDEPTNILGSTEGEEYLDFIYDDRAGDYEDNLPDVTKQIYQNNGNQQLRYSTGFEYHIFEGLHRPNLHYDDEDDFEF